MRLLLSSVLIAVILTGCAGQVDVNKSALISKVAMEALAQEVVGLYLDGKISEQDYRRVETIYRVWYLSHVALVEAIVQARDKPSKDAEAVLRAKIASEAATSKAYQDIANEVRRKSQ